VKKVTKKDFKLFVNGFTGWQTFFGLSDYRVNFYHDQLEEDIAANITTDLEARVCEVRLTTQIVDGGEIDFRQVAFHEACELLLNDLSELATRRYLRGDDEVAAARHAIIRRLENSVYRSFKL